MAACETIPFHCSGLPICRQARACRRKNKEELHRMLFLARTVPPHPLAQPKVIAKTRAVAEQAPGEFLSFPCSATRNLGLEGTQEPASLAWCNQRLYKSFQKWILLCQTQLSLCSPRLFQNLLFGWAGFQLEGVHSKAVMLALLPALAFAYRCQL